MRALDRARHRIGRRTERIARLALAFALCPLLLAGLASGLAAPSSAHAESTEARYEAALAAFDADRAGDAARIWREIGNDLVAGAPDPADRRYAALLFVYSTMSFELADDAEAYPTWGLAIRHFLESGTRWEVERERLREAIREIRLLLQSADATVGGVVAPAREDERLLALADRLDATGYDGPTQGLATVEDESEENLSIQRQYFAQARPQTSATEYREPSQVRFGRATDIEQDTAEFGSQRRGFGDVPVEPPPRITAPPVGSIRRDEKAAGIVDPAGSGQGPPTAAELGELPPPPSASFRHEHLAERETIDETAADGSETAPASSAPLDPLVSVFRDPPPAWTETHREIAETAWKYFEVNHQPDTGLFNSVHRYTFTTLWDVGSGLAGLVAAHQIGVLEDEKFHRWMGLGLDTIAQLPTYRGELPNREYSTETGRMIDLRGRASNEGSGWSALDIGRLMTWLRITHDLYPEHRESIERAVDGWDFARLAAKGQMDGTYYNGSEEKLRQEGRLGYEQYAASGYREWGIVLPRALDYEEVKPVSILGVDFAHDPRNRAYLTSEPFVLAALEYGEIDPFFTELTQAMFDLQRRRYETAGILTAVSEDAIDKQPWFLYNTVFFEGKPWPCVRPNGAAYPELRTVSTKAALGWDALFGGDYGSLLFETALEARHSSFGFYAGTWESGGINRSLNINTNAVILEAMLYRFRGGVPFIASRPPRGPDAPNPQP